MGKLSDQSRRKRLKTNLDTLRALEFFKTGKARISLGHGTTPLPVGQPFQVAEDAHKYSEYTLKNSAPAPKETETSSLFRGLKERDPTGTVRVPTYYTTDANLAEQYRGQPGKRSVAVAKLPLGMQAVSREQFFVVSPHRLLLRGMTSSQIEGLAKTIPEQVYDDNAVAPLMENIRRDFNNIYNLLDRALYINKLNKFEDMLSTGRYIAELFKNSFTEKTLSASQEEMQTNLQQLEKTIKRLTLDINEKYNEDIKKIPDDYIEKLSYIKNAILLSQENIKTSRDPFEFCPKDLLKPESLNKQEALTLAYHLTCDKNYEILEQVGIPEAHEQTRTALLKARGFYKEMTSKTPDMFRDPELSFLVNKPSIIQNVAEALTGINASFLTIENFFKVFNERYKAISEGPPISEDTDLAVVETPRGTRIYNCVMEPLFPPSIEEAGLSEEVKAFLQRKILRSPPTGTEGSDDYRTPVIWGVGLTSLHIEEVYQKMTAFSERSQIVSPDHQELYTRSIIEILNEYSDKLENEKVSVPLMLATREFIEILKKREAFNTLPADQRLTIELLKCGVTRKNLPPRSTEKFSALSQENKSHFFAMLEDFDRQYFMDNFITTHLTHQMFQSPILLEAVIDNPEQWFNSEAFKKREIIGREYARHMCLHGDQALDAHEIHTRSDALLRTYGKMFERDDPGANKEITFKRIKNLHENGEVSKETKDIIENVMNDTATVRLNPAQKKWMHEMNKLEGREISLLISIMINSFPVKSAAESSASAVSAVDNQKLVTFLNNLAPEITALGATCNLATFETALAVYDATKRGFDERANEIFIKDYAEKELKRLGDNGEISPIEETEVTGKTKYTTETLFISEEIFKTICASEEMYETFTSKSELSNESFEDKLKVSDAKLTLRKTAEYLLSTGIYKEIAVVLGTKTEQATEAEIAAAMKPTQQDVEMTEATQQDVEMTAATQQDVEGGEYWYDPAGNIVADKNGTPYKKGDNFLKYTEGEKKGEIVLDDNGIPYYDDGYIVWDGKTRESIEWNERKVPTDQIMPHDGIPLYRKQVIKRQEAEEADDCYYGYDEEEEDYGSDEEEDYGSDEEMDD